MHVFAQVPALLCCAGVPVSVVVPHNLYSTPATGVFTSAKRPKLHSTGWLMKYQPTAFVWSWALQ
ncbi:hypothetical protein CFELI_14190 [Corynebacterium felinum]|uniref:Secreted protein n=1 Tax=Corynebacterium felinum TaxID=131318 RepID=A0ABU2B6J8_9CORY|nr:hypothetical protein [Corynebacterium felinum]WJY96409.1 hypothetical protein CFELI_14190 [Corynebacterium felinum]